MTGIILAQDRISVHALRAYVFKCPVYHTSTSTLPTLFGGLRSQQVIAAALHEEVEQHWVGVEDMRQIYYGQTEDIRMQEPLKVLKPVHKYNYTEFGSGRAKIWLHKRLSTAWQPHTEHNSTTSAGQRLTEAMTTRPVFGGGGLGNG